MGLEVIVRVDDLEFSGRLYNTPTGRAVARALPLTAGCQRWGEEFYGSIGLSADQEPDASDLVEAGDLAFWPPGSALCPAGP